MSEEKKGKTTPEARIEQYLMDLTLKNGQLWCPWCSIVPDASRKAAIDYHVASKSHKKNRFKENQRSLTEFIPLQTDSSKSFLAMLLCSEYIKQKSCKNFLNKRIPTLKVPSESVLINDSIPKLYEEARRFIKTNYSKFQFVILIDETQDNKSRCVVNTIAYFVQTKEYILLDTFFDTHVDNLIIVKIVNNVIADFNMSWNSH